MTVATVVPPCRGDIKVLEVEGREVALALAATAPGDGPLAAAARDVGERLAAERIDQPRATVRMVTLPPSGRPVLLVAGRPVEASVSLSHVDGLVAAAVAEGVGVGIDLVDPAEAGRGLDVWFTPDELALEPDEGLLRARLWAAKEAAYKAAGIDDELRPRSVVIESLAPRSFTWTVRSRYVSATGSGRFLAAGRHVVAVAVTTRRGAPLPAAADRFAPPREVILPFAQQPATPEIVSP
jgi:hypothetical protein